MGVTKSADINAMIQDATVWKEGESTPTMDIPFQMKAVEECENRCYALLSELMEKMHEGEISYPYRQVHKEQIALDMDGEKGMVEVSILVEAKNYREEPDE